MACFCQDLLTNTIVIDIVFLTSANPAAASALAHRAFKLEDGHD
jgi:hypothetical protein